MNTQAKPRKRKAETRTVSIVLSPEDEKYLGRLAKEYGLIKTTDCLRLAMREAVKRLDQQTV